jgi:hypothetical protein
MFHDVSLERTEVSVKVSCSGGFKVHLIQEAQTEIFQNDISSKHCCFAVGSTQHGQKEARE